MPSPPSVLPESPAESAVKNPVTTSVTTIDLRSDTVTKPTVAMRAAMASAEVGDDVYAEDPTVNLIEAHAAEVFGREAAIFVPTGTMGNQIAIRLHTHHGQEVISESRAHVVDWEMAMAASFSGVQLRTVFAERGTVTPLDIYQDIWWRAAEIGLPVHLDGARVFNAATALGIPVAELTSGFSSVMFCLSKGLCAP